MWNPGRAPCVGPRAAFQHNTRGDSAMYTLLKTYTDPALRAQAQALAAEDVARHRWLYGLEGALFLLLAALILSAPMLTAITVEVVLAALLLVGGAVRMARAIWSEPRASGRLWRLGSGAVYALVGGAMLAWPAIGLAALIWAIGLLLIVEGAFEISAGAAAGWGLMLFTGIVSVVLGALVLAQMPWAGVVFIAVSLGLSMGLYGLALVIAAIAGPTNAQGQAAPGDQNAAVHRYHNL